MKILSGHVLTVFTGGTISVSPSRNDASPSLGGRQLAGRIEKYHNIPVKSVDLYRSMSESLTFNHVRKLAAFLQESMEQQDVVGVVVSHGTDTLDEVAYFIDLLQNWKKPIIFTGAMRHSELLSADGPANLVDAIRTAYASDSTNRGVLVVMNQEIHAARYVVKEHSTNLGAFSSPGAGPMGSVLEQQIRYSWSISPREKEYRLPEENKVPDVQVLRMTLANSGLLLRACLEHHVDGVVIEGFGAGHVPEYLLPDIEKLLTSRIPVWVVPRTPFGHPLLSTYGTPGSEINLQSMGVRMEEGPGYKARLRMILELADSKH